MTKPTLRDVSTCRARRCARRCASSWPRGLVEARAHRGAVVARPSIDRLTGMFEAMAELEALCAGLAAERMTPAERHRLEAVHEELRVLSHAGNPDRFHEVNERFHNTIYAGSQNDYIAEITLATRVRVQPFRRAQFRNLGRLAKSHAEHDRVVVAILRGDRSARPQRCARISSWCATNTRSTRCRCRHGAIFPPRPARGERSTHVARRVRGVSPITMPGKAPHPRASFARLDHGKSGAREPTRSARSRFRHKGAPAAERGNLARAVDIGGFDDKALDAAAVGEAHGADRQRRRDGGDEFSE